MRESARQRDQERERVRRRRGRGARAHDLACESESTHYQQNNIGTTRKEASIHYEKRPIFIWIETCT